MWAASSDLLNHPHTHIFKYIYSPRISYNKVRKLIFSKAIKAVKRYRVRDRITSQGYNLRNQLCILPSLSIECHKTRAKVSQLFRCGGYWRWGVWIACERRFSCTVWWGGIFPHGNLICHSTEFPHNWPSNGWILGKNLNCRNIWLDWPLNSSKLIFRIPKEFKFLNSSTTSSSHSSSWKYPSNVTTRSLNILKAVGIYLMWPLWCLP